MLPDLSENRTAEKSLDASFEQYRVRRDIIPVISVMAIANTISVKMWLIRLPSSGIAAARPTIRRLVISRGKMPVLQPGSSQRSEGSVQISGGNKSSTALATFGGVKTSSLDRFEMTSKMSGWLGCK